MDYEKAYKEALKKIREGLQPLPDCAKIYGVTRAFLEEVFPELQESEDEKIRKALIRFHKSTIDVDGIKGEDIIAWLEKQGEKKPIDKVEQKFHEGDWIIDKQGIVHQIEKVIENVTNNTFGYDLVGGGYFNEEVKSCRLWTIQDAKDGDVLACGDKVTDCPFIFHNLTEELNPRSYCGVNTLCHFQDNDENGGFWCKSDEVRPATKEQRDLLFAKMKEDGYEWDAEKKELKLLISNGGDFESPIWSKEDEIGFSDTLWAIQQARIITKDENDMGNLWYAEDWLKSLKERLS